MAPLDVTPTKEIRGITLRSALQAIIVIFTVVVAYANTTNAIDKVVLSNKETKELIKEMQQYNSVQIDLIKNQLREQDVRLIRLEAKQEINGNNTK